MPIHIIDDDPVIRKLMLEIAASHSQSCSTFDSAETYLAHIQSDTFVEARLIITDVMMSGMHGYELIRTIQSLGLTSKIILISGNFSEHIDKPHNSVCGIVHKPFNIRRMQSVLAIILSCQCQHTENQSTIAYWPGIRIKCPHSQPA